MYVRRFALALSLSLSFTPHYAASHAYLVVSSSHSLSLSLSLSRRRINVVAVDCCCAQTASGLSVLEGISQECLCQFALLARRLVQWIVFFFIFCRRILRVFERTETLDGALQTLVAGLFAQSFREDLVGGLNFEAD